MVYFSEKNHSWVCVPFCCFAYYINNELECVLDFYDDYEVSIDDFIHRSRHYVARLFNVPWERIQLKLVDAVSGVVPTLPVVVSLME